MTSTTEITKIPGIKTAKALRERFSELGYRIPVIEKSADNAAGFPCLASSLQAGSRKIGNRFAILPMEGWDAEKDGRPSELVERRWLNFGTSGAKLLWGCEAAAVNHTGRANPRQLVINNETVGDIAKLYQRVRKVHADRFGTDDDLVVGLQLTHSGRWCRPDDLLAPRIVYRHPELDTRVRASDANLMSDQQIEELVELYIDRARLAAKAGFDFVDIKHCHGYFGHELLSAVNRPGRYGGSLENRSRFLRDVITGIKQKSLEIAIGVRLSAYDFLSYKPGASRVGEPVTVKDDFRFGADSTGLGIDLTEPVELLTELRSLGVHLICITAGSPYYNPHIQRPALYPPSDGYRPPEDPLAGVARMIQATAELKSRCPDLTIVGSGYTYLQEWLPQVAEAVVENNMVDSVGIGRMALSYSSLPEDVLQGNGLDRKKICRTFSDCTTAPRQGLISGCYPLDSFYKSKEEASQLKEIKKTLGRGNS
jgi:2,4-dienoyl-CoA reductase-like NADH-dependent reductase (Old Yellow Enzyme family)